MNSDLTSSEQLSVAFMVAFREYPYFASGFALLVRRIADLPSESMAVTRDGILLVDPKFLALYEARQLAEVLAHELLHLLREHGERSDRIPWVDRDKWNIAADCEINCSLQQAHLPGDPCLPNKFSLPNGLLAEEYYNKLPTTSNSGSRGVCGGLCGSGSGGSPIDGEPAEGTEEGRSSADITRMKQAVAVAVIEHASRNAGNVPSDLLRWANQKLRPPKVCWRDKLKRIIRSDISWAAGKTDYTWSRPSRRSQCQQAVGRALGSADVLLPSLRGWQPHIAIGVDTSGSMSEDQLTQVMSEVEGVIKAAGAPVIFLAFDCQLSGPPKKIRCAADAIACVRGGGGTDFNVVMEAAVRLKPKPSLLILLTDGWGPAPKLPPNGMSVIWVLVGCDVKKPVDWGDSVIVAEEQDE